MPFSRTRTGRYSVEVPFLPRMLKERGYKTGAAVSSFVLRRKMGLAEEFDFYEDSIEFREDIGRVFPFFKAFCVYPFQLNGTVVGYTRVVKGFIDALVGVVMLNVFTYSSNANGFVDLI